MPAAILVNPGDRYGMLTILSEVEKTTGRRMLCLCHCGRQTVVTLNSLRTGKTLSCGCYRKVVTSESSTTHGKRHTKLYNTWAAMKQRCYNVKCRGYQYYGSKGITICDEWLDFQAFSKWALANGYKSGLTIERKDPAGNYEPDNCTWIAKELQPKNTARGIYLKFNGVVKDMADWADSLGIKHATIRSRYYRGMTIDKILQQ